MTARRVRLRRRGPAAPAPTGACAAPSTSLYLDQRGLVRACCQNSAHVLGRVGPERLLDIWHGERARALRAALARHDLGLGCDFCAWLVDAGRPDLAYARAYDDLPVEGPADAPAWPTQLEMSLSNTCNLQCAMCNGEWSSAIRRHREGLPPLPSAYDDRFFEDLRAFVPHLRRVKVLGGEPFLASETLRVLDLLVEAGSPAQVHVTTNGTQWTPRVRRILAALACDVVVSLDSVDPATYAAVRQGSDLATVTANLARYRDAIGGRGVLVLTTCLMTTTWEGFVDVCAYADELGVELGVNTVSDPAALSLYRLPPDELEAVVDALDATDAERGAGLGPSRAVWDAERARLRRHLEDRRAGRPVPWLDDRRDDPVIAAAHHERAVAAQQRELDALAAAWAPPAATRLVVRDGTVEAARGDRPLLGHDPDGLPGGRVDALLAAIAADHGPPGPEVLLAGDPDRATAVERRFPSGLRLRSVSGPGAGPEAGATVVWVGAVPDAGPAAGAR